MKVTVLLRVIEDPELAAGVSRSTLRLDDSALVALGMALSLMRKDPGVRLAGVAAGPPSWDRSLQEALAAGLQSVTRVWSEGMNEADVPATAAALANGVDSDTDLVISGAASGDHGSGTLPGAVAELLGLPILADVAGLAAGPEGVVAQVRGEGGRRRRYRVPAKAMVVATRLPAPPIFPPLARRLTARKTHVPETTPVSTRLVTGAAGRISLIDYGPARPLTRHLIKPSASANPADRLRLLMSGGMSGRGGQTLDSSGAGGGGLAKQLAEILVKEGFLA
jgi:electron transfer flavoprotein alpha/beta subunit